MKIKRIGDIKTIMSNPNSRHNYFGWPTAVRLQDGRIAVGASGFRLDHICPFGKAVVSFSNANGETYTFPAPVIDTPLDDRDAGLCTFGESGLIITSFNNSADMQRQHNKDNKYIQSYVDTITKEDEEKYLGSIFRISFDCGKTFGEIFHSPVSCPHGPTELRDGTILWVGNNFKNYGLEVFLLNPYTAEMQFVGKIINTHEKAVLAEPYLIEMPDGKLICQIRGEKEDDSVFTVFQSVSYDKGKTWSEPKMLLDITGGAPPHMILLKSGALLSTYGRRKEPYGIMAMVSLDGGETWETDIPLCENLATDDLGYPSTVELPDNTLLTIFYANDGEDMPCKILQQKWQLEI